MNGYPESLVPAWRLRLWREWLKKSTSQANWSDQHYGKDGK